MIDLYRISTTSEQYYFVFPITLLSVLAARIIMESGVLNLNSVYS
jgi:hypothetical protein